MRYFGESKMADETWYEQFYDFQGSVLDPVVTGSQRTEVVQYLRKYFSQCSVELAPSTRYPQGALLVVHVYRASDRRPIQEYIEKTLGFHLVKETSHSD